MKSERQPSKAGQYLLPNTCYLVLKPLPVCLVENLKGRRGQWSGDGDRISFLLCVTDDH